ncbi:MAG: hypothetical protein QOF89_2576 [Acidobacteriota bacterium]|jgi:hypothetical protein|nr:hypothetical protein [Acidobacteriota bacterium]
MRHLVLLLLATALLLAQNVALASTDTFSESHARALGLLQSDQNIMTKAGTLCSGGIQYDDGTFENGYGFQDTVFAGTYGMRFSLPASTNRLTAVCICWQSLGGSSHDYGLRIWAADGPGGAPGTLLQVLPAATATGINSTATWVRYEIPSGLNVATNSIYVAPTWAASLFTNRFLCADENGPGGKPAYIGVYSASNNPDIRPTAQIGVTGTFPEYKALGIRLEAEATSACVPTPTALCLNSGRFKVEATFDTGAQSGNAQVVKLTDETGYLWFFNSVNVEVVVKVINACSFNQRFWVYAGGLTDQGVVLTVTDTSKGTSKTYTNPRGQKWVTITDSSALATCP